MVGRCDNRADREFREREPSISRTQERQTVHSRLGAVIRGSDFRVMAIGLSKHEAQVNICRAIADRKIKIRYMIASEEIGGIATPSGHGMAGHVINRLDIIPTRLAPRDFDWRKSRPKKPWQVPPNPVFWHLAWIEVFSADVTKVLCSGQQPRIRKVNLYHGGDRQRDQQARQRRADRIRWFSENQKRTRHWINFAEIAVWCSELSGSVVPDEGARASAYDKLQRDLLEGDFEEMAVPACSTCILGL